MMICRDGGELGRATQGGWWFQNRPHCLGSAAKALSWRTSGTGRRSEPLAQLGPLPSSVWSFSAQEVRIFFSLNRSHTRLLCWILPPVRMETLPWATCPVRPPPLVLNFRVNEWPTSQGRHGAHFRSPSWWPGRRRNTVTSCGLDFHLTSSVCTS